MTFGQETTRGPFCPCQTKSARAPLCSEVYHALEALRASTHNDPCRPRRLARFTEIISANARFTCSIEIVRVVEMIVLHAFFAAFTVTEITFFLFLVFGLAGRTIPINLHALYLMQLLDRILLDRAIHDG